MERSATQDSNGSWIFHPPDSIVVVESEFEHGINDHEKRASIRPLQAHTSRAIDPRNGWLCDWPWVRVSFTSTSFWPWPFVSTAFCGTSWGPR